mmetsp:Transcript_1383/g.1988  ORF Transcript_1383/g.1988 Transcript_1383/m.1988 type:complete len:297 (-) Transcript_1383:434-1324(-)|eukprot:CAMPEP_0184857676 /NCGR_PEP_ID=MMETSP0580-20130426/2821_1 /TAXON_ID=1118495 /ORGANISM="Dactyliosolen fragilissimus" /LENGTH=296 /DNA_ID=CAMNT_0027353401 /DNA_START=38 /DNA_END=928 /DNA_ORIENTATION=-
MRISSALLFAYAASSNGFSFAPPDYVNTKTLSSKNQSFRSSLTQLKMSLKESTYDALSSKITMKLELQTTDFTQTYEGDSWKCSKTGVEGTAEWMSESSPKFLTGVSYCTRNGSSGDEQMINVWMGPSYDVPHMLLKFGHKSSDDTYYVIADYIVRGGTPIGSDPQMLEAYYGLDVASAWTKAMKNDGAYALPPSMQFDSRIISSPAQLAVGGLSKIDADSIAMSHVDRFLSWLDDAKPVMARSRGAFNLRDDKIRQYYYKGEVKKNVEEFGEKLGPIVGAVNTGPTAEAYVGGGS